MADTILLKLDIDADDLADQLADSMSRDDAITLVKALDERMQEWDFTLALYEHFAQLKKEFDAEEAEDKEKLKQKERKESNPPCGTCTMPVDDNGFCQNPNCH